LPAEKLWQRLDNKGVIVQTFRDLGGQKSVKLSDALDSERQEATQRMAAVGTTEETASKMAQMIAKEIAVQANKDAAGAQSQLIMIIGSCNYVAAVGNDVNVDAKKAAFDNAFRTALKNDRGISRNFVIFTQQTAEVQRIVQSVGLTGHQTVADPTNPGVMVNYDPALVRVVDVSVQPSEDGIYELWQMTAVFKKPADPANAARGATIVDSKSFSYRYVYHPAFNEFISQDENMELWSKFIAADPKKSQEHLEEFNGLWKRKYPADWKPVPDAPTVPSTRSN
jgi:hypothetical protein